MMSRRKGYQRVSVQVSGELFAFAQAVAESEGYFGAADYLNALLNTALLAEIEASHALPRRHDEQCAAEDGPPPAADPDDDLPF